MIQVKSAKFASSARTSEIRNLEVLPQYPAFFELSGDTIERVYVSEKDPIFSTNLKKGIMAIFQLKQDSGERTEVSAICKFYH